MTIAGTDLRALREHPFELLRELERRSRLAITGNPGDDASAEEWVGIGARIIRSRSGQVVGKISADGQRLYRTTSLNKAQPYINLESKTSGGNLHIRW